MVQGAAIVMAPLVVWVMWETLSLSVLRVEVPIEGLPLEFDGFRLAHISDWHGHAFNPEGSEVQAIRAGQVDVIVATGDFVHRRSVQGVRRITPFAQELVRIAPVYAVSGNHDHRTDWPYIAIHLRAAGVTVLENSHVRIRRGNGEIILAGVCDPDTGHARLNDALPIPNDAVIVLLAHTPAWFEPWNAVRVPTALKRVSLTLVGHTHGGQVKLPFFGAVTTASGRLFPPSHVEGLTREGNGWLYINRGLSQGDLALRFLSRREVTIITLRQQT